MRQHGSRRSDAKPSISKAHLTQSLAAVCALPVDARARPDALRSRSRGTLQDTYVPGGTLCFRQRYKRKARNVGALLPLDGAVAAEATLGPPWRIRPRRKLAWFRLRGDDAVAATQSLGTARRSTYPRDGDAPRCLTTGRNVPREASAPQHLLGGAV